MKSLTGALVSLAVGTALGVVAVIGIKAAVNPTATTDTGSQSPISVLEYGNNG